MTPGTEDEALALVARLVLAALERADEKNKLKKKNTITVTRRHKSAVPSGGDAE